MEALDEWRVGKKRIAKCSGHWGGRQDRRSWCRELQARKARSESDELKGRRVVRLRAVMVCNRCEGAGATIDSGGCAINIGP
jgi:hypothetical protein